MSTSRREFLKISGLTGMGLASTSVLKGYDHLQEGKGKKPAPPHFNMSGYAAPKIETVRIGFIGLGNRGPAAVERMTHIEGTDIKALCDLRPEKADAVKKKLENTPHRPEVYTGKEEEWKKMCERADIDLAADASSLCDSGSGNAAGVQHGYPPRLQWSQHLACLSWQSNERAGSD